MLEAERALSSPLVERPHERGGRETWIETRMLHNPRKEATPLLRGRLVSWWYRFVAFKDKKRGTMGFVGSGEKVPLFAISAEDFPMADPWDVVCRASTSACEFSHSSRNRDIENHR